MTDVDAVGGKNASLGEMISQLAGAGIRVPGGFATTAAAFREFLSQDRLGERIAARLEGARRRGRRRARARRDRDSRLDHRRRRCSPRWRRRSGTPMRSLSAGDPDASWAVRSSATAEDLPDASFAGQQETFLNINGLENILHAVKEVFASLYNDRAIAYRVHKGFAQAEVALSAGVQRMVRSDTGAAGVMFTLDTESGFDQVVFITASYGLGETVVQGAVNPDEFYVYKRNVEAGRPAILRKTVGAKAVKMVFARRSGGRPLGAYRRRARGRAAALLDHRRRSRGARTLRDRDREALRPADGHRMGPRRRQRQALHPAGAARDGEVAGGGGRVAQALSPEIDVEGARDRTRDRPEDRAGPRAPREVGGPDGARRRPATCSSPK